jgi:hypothetical protein
MNRVRVLCVLAAPWYLGTLHPAPILPLSPALVFSDPRYPLCPLPFSSHTPPNGPAFIVVGFSFSTREARQVFRRA